MKTIYYYQSFCGLDKIMKDSQNVDNIILSSFHFGKDNNNKSYIHLNDNCPEDEKFNLVWEQLTKLYYDGVMVTLMIGGAGGGFSELFSDFETYYNLLKNTIQKHNFLSGVDLDIEEGVKLNDVKNLINRLVDDFGEDFIITMAPVANSLINNTPGMGNFNYNELYKSLEGRHINWFNVQCYGCYNFETYDSIIKNGYPESKIIFGMISGDFINNFPDALKEIQKVKNKYPKFLGADVWEYINAPPNTDDPSMWAKEIKELEKNSEFTNRKFLGVWGP